MKSLFRVTLLSLLMWGFLPQGIGSTAEAERESSKPDLYGSVGKVSQVFRGCRSLEGMAGLSSPFMFPLSPSQRQGTVSFSSMGFENGLTVHLLNDASLPKFSGMSVSSQVVLVPRQDIVLKSDLQSPQGTSAMHWAQVGQIRYEEGFYALVPEAALPPLLQRELDQDLPSKMARLTLPRSENDLIAGRYYLMSTAALDDLRNGQQGGVGQRWHYEKNISVPQVSVLSSGEVITPRGTIYRWQSNGSVNVWTRNGTHYSDFFPVFENFASHAEILRRQGRSFRDLDDRGAVATLVSLNQEVIATHWRREGANFENMNRLVDEATEKARLAKNTQLPNQKRTAAVLQALRSGDQLNEFLPPELKWRNFGGSFLVPQRGESGEIATSIILPFLLVRSLNSQNGPEIRLLDGQNGHFVVLHAHLAEGAFSLSEAGLVTGGNLLFAYDPKTASLSEIRVVSQGIVAPEACYSESFREEDKAQLIASLKRRLQFFPGGKNVIVE